MRPAFARARRSRSNFDEEKFVGTGVLTFFASVLERFLDLLLFGQLVLRPTRRHDEAGRPTVQDLAGTGRISCDR